MKNSKIFQSAVAVIFVSSMSSVLATTFTRVSSTYVNTDLHNTTVPMELTAVCPSGSVVVGGGYTMTDYKKLLVSTGDAQNYFDFPPVTVTESRNYQGGWRVKGRAVAYGKIQVTAICASL